jgi:hypothetical protein
LSCSLQAGIQRQPGAEVPPPPQRQQHTCVLYRSGEQDWAAGWPATAAVDTLQHPHAAAAVHQCRGIVLDRSGLQRQTQNLLVTCGCARGIQLSLRGVATACH